MLGILSGLRKKDWRIFTIENTKGSEKSELCKKGSTSSRVIGIVLERQDP